VAPFIGHAEQIPEFTKQEHRLSFNR